MIGAGPAALRRADHPQSRDHRPWTGKLIFWIGASLATAGVQVSALAQVAILPVRIVNDIVIVEVAVNGHGPFPFILDTGFGQDVVGTETAREAGLELLDVGVEIRGQGGATPRALFARNVRLSVDREISWSGQLMALPLDHLESRLGVHADGILGSPIFQAYVVEIDYAAPAVRLWDADTYVVPADAVTLPLQLHASRPHVEVRLEPTDRKPVRATLMLDTGANVGVALSSTYAAWRPDSTGSGTLTTAEGIGGAVRFLAKTEAVLLLGSRRLSDVEVAFSAEALEKGTGTPAEGLLGGRAFRGLSLTLDYGRKRAYVSRPR